MAWITTAHLAQAKKFFQDDLGLEVTSSHEEMGWLEFGPQGVDGMKLGVGAVCDEQPTHKPGDNAVLTFTVDNLDEAIDELKAKGVTFEGEVQEVPGHVRMIAFFDKDHNRFQLVEMLGNF